MTKYVQLTRLELRPCSHAAMFFSRVCCGSSTHNRTVQCSPRAAWPIPQTTPTDSEDSDHAILTNRAPSPPLQVPALHDQVSSRRHQKPQKILEARFEAKTKVLNANAIRSDNHEGRTNGSNGSNVGARRAMSQPQPHEQRSGPVKKGVPPDSGRCRVTSGRTPGRSRSRPAFGCSHARRAFASTSP